MRPGSTWQRLGLLLDLSQVDDFDKHAKSLLEQFDIEIPYNDHVNIRWKYVEQVLNCLQQIVSENHHLKKESEINTSDDPQEEKEKEDLTFSLKQIATLQKAMEFVCLWGIYPYLLPNVGISVPSSTTSAQAQKLNASEFPQDANERLFRCAKSIIDIGALHKQLSVKLWTALVSFVFAGLIQCAYGPSVQVEQFVPSSPGEIDTFSEKDLSKTEEAKSILNDTINRIQPKYLFIGLMTLSQPNAPLWLQQTCGRYLSQILMSRKGVLSLLSLLLPSDIDNGGSSGLYHAQQVITSCPRQASSIEMYYKYICPQLIDIMHMSGKNSHYYVKTAGIICGSIIQKEPSLGKKYILNPITKPLQKLNTLDDKYSFNFGVQKNDNDDNDEKIKEEDDLSRETIVVPEEDITSCVEDLHKLIVEIPPSQTVFAVVAEVIPAMFQMYCFLSRTILNLKTACEEIMTTYFRKSDTAVHTLKVLVWPHFSYNQTGLGSSHYATFAPGDSGGVVIKIRPSSERDYDWEGKCAISLMKQMKNDELIGDLFVDLLGEFCIMKQKGIHNESYILLLQILSLLCEELGATVLRNTRQTLSLLRIMLIDHQRDPESTDSETLSMILGLITTIIAGGLKLRSGDVEQLHALKPLIEELIQYPEEHVAEIAGVIVSSIAVMKIEEYPDDLKEDKEKKITMRKVLKQLQDPLLPIRAGGLINLRRLVLERDPAVKKHLEKILEIFKSEIRDSDSYIYQFAISGLSALGDVFTDKIIPILTDSFEDENLDPVHRMKIGEALLFIAERCGEILPEYAKYFVHAFLSVAGRDTEEDMLRASALSDLATVSEVLRYGLHPFIQNIVDETIHLLSVPSSSIVVKRGAAFLHVSLFQGLQQGVFHVMPDELSRVRTTLKYVADTDEDHVVRVHARNALAALDEIVSTALDVNVPQSERKIK